MEEKMSGQAEREKGLDIPSGRRMIKGRFGGRMRERRRRRRRRKKKRKSEMIKGRFGGGLHFLPI